MLVACLLIGEIFLSALIGHELALVMIGFFALSLLFLIASLIFFLRDLFLSLDALGIELKQK